MSGKPFAQGHDPRRNTGRLPTSQAVNRVIRRELGKDAGAIVAKIRAQAAEGDPHALLAAAYLIGAVIDNADIATQKQRAVPEG